MSSAIAYVLLFVTTVTAWRAGRQHEPIALALSWACIGNYLESQPIPALMIYMATATTPVAIVAAVWAARKSRTRSYFTAMFGVGAVFATLLAMVADRFGVFGQCMAYFWVLCALTGGAGLRRSEAPPLTRSVLILLVGALPCEAGGWLAWGAGFDLGYAFSRMITILNFLIILGIQVSDGVTWPRWATLRGLRRWRTRSDSSANPTDEPPSTEDAR